MNLLSQYGESESEGECGGGQESSKKEEARLPVPDFLLNVTRKKTALKEENNEGKIRNFPHEPGNWATYVYVPLNTSFELEDYLVTLISFFKPLDLKVVEDFHISLTRTVILRHHWIEDFMESVKKSLVGISSFKIHLCGLKTYTNEEQTRSFLSLKVDEGEEDLKLVVMQLDTCLGEYNLQGFYQDPSFHVSLLWCPGDRHSDIDTLIDLLPPNLKSFELSADVSHCVCASGNKRFRFNFHQCRHQ